MLKPRVVHIVGWCFTFLFFTLCSYIRLVESSKHILIKMLITRVVHIVGWRFTFLILGRLWGEAPLIKKPLLAWHGPALPVVLPLLPLGLLEVLSQEVFLVHLGPAFLLSLVQEAYSGSGMLSPLQVRVVLQRPTTVFHLLLHVVSPMSEQSLSWVEIEALHISENNSFAFKYGAVHNHTKVWSPMNNTWKTCLSTEYCYLHDGGRTSWRLEAEKVEDREILDFFSFPS